MVTRNTDPLWFRLAELALLPVSLIIAALIAGRCPVSRLQEAERLLAKLADECDDLKVTRYHGARHDPDCTVCAVVAEARAFLAAAREALRQAGAE